METAHDALGVLQSTVESLDFLPLEDFVPETLVLFLHTPADGFKSAYQLENGKPHYKIRHYPCETTLRWSILYS